LKDNILKNSAFLFVARAINPAVTIIIGFYIAKKLGVGYFGQFTFILTYFFIMSIVFSLGLGTIVGRDTAKSPEEAGDYFLNASLIGVASGAVGLIVILLTSHFFNLSEEGKRGLYIISLSIFPSILIYIWESLLITFERNHYIVIIQAVESAVKIVLGFFVLTMGYGLVALMGVFLIARVTGAVLYYFALTRMFRPLTLSPNIKFIRKIITMVPTFAGLYIFSVIFSKIDVMMIALIKDYNDVGIYSAAYRLLETSFMLPACIIAVFFPVLSRYAKTSKQDLAEISAKGIFYSAAVLVPVALALMYFAGPLIYTFYSHEFGDSVLPFQILIVTLGFYMVDQIFAHSLVASDLQSLNLRTVVTGTIINIVLNLVLIPRYSYIGASIATLVSMASVTAIHYYFVSEHLYRFDPVKLSAALTLAAVLFLILYVMRGVPLVILLPVSGTIYAFFIIAVKVYFLRCGEVSTAYK
jgi:O-antigen/teichoic acid export membrane protein